MAEQWKSEKLEHRNGFIEKEKKQSKYTENSVAMAPNNNNKSNSVAGILGDMDLTLVKDLSLRSKQFKHLPEELGWRLKNLMYLDLSDNSLESLPFSLQHLAHLKSLILTQNLLSTLPLTVTRLTNLRVLQIAQNSILSLPNNFGDLTLLESLDLSSNCIKELPDSCENLNQLKYLNLNNNCFRKLPDCIARGMRALETLDVSKNLYINIAIPPATKKLKSLYARNCGPGVKFPTWLLRGRAPLLQVFCCDGTKFKYFAFPDNRPSLKLQILSMEACSIFDSFVQEMTTQTDELRTLRVGNKDWMKNSNAFWALPILNLKRPRLLTEISVRGTGLPNVCPEIKNFINLVALDLGDNRLNWLPDEICQLANLNVLMVDENQLSSLPENIGSMTSLKELKASKNHLASLPGSIKDLKELSYLDLYDNEFQEVPEDLKHIKSLLGVDFDLNNFEIDDLCIGDLQYEALRNTLRKKYQTDDFHRTTGPRYESENEELFDSRSDTSSDSDEPETTVVADEINKNIENWDESDDAADDMEFDCERTVSPKQEIVYFSTVLLDRLAFCPADLHKLPVRQQVALSRERGELKDDFEVVEGQFDDF